MSTKPAPRCPGCGAKMELTEVSKHTWRYSCDDCGWRSPLVRGLGKEGKDVAYTKAMRRYRPEHDGYQGEPTQPVKIWHAAEGGRMTWTET